MLSRPFMPVLIKLMQAKAFSPDFSSRACLSALSAQCVVSGRLNLHSSIRCPNPRQQPTPPTDQDRQNVWFSTEDCVTFSFPARSSNSSPISPPLRAPRPHPGYSYVALRCHHVNTGQRQLLR
jgi:hypothetical protein